MGEVRRDIQESNVQESGNLEDQERYVRVTLICLNILNEIVARVGGGRG